VLTRPIKPRNQKGCNENKREGVGETLNLQKRLCSWQTHGGRGGVWTKKFELHKGVVGPKIGKKEDQPKGRGWKCAGITSGTRKKPGEGGKISQGGEAVTACKGKENQPPTEVRETLNVSGSETQFCSVGERINKEGSWKESNLGRDA